MTDSSPDLDRVVTELRITVSTLASTVQTLVRTTEKMADVAVSKDAHESLAKRVDAIEGWQTWAIRIVVGAVIAAAMALIISQGGAA